MGYNTKTTKTSISQKVGLQEIAAHNRISAYSRLQSIDGNEELIIQVCDVKYWEEKKEQFGSWEKVFSTHKIHIGMGMNLVNRICFGLKCGGTLTFFKNFLSETRCKALLENVYQCNLLRQYQQGSLQYNEPRLQALFCSATHLDGGYHYHGTSLKPLSLSNVPDILTLSNELEMYFGIECNIGVHMMFCHGGEDSIGWHADDTQGESLIIAVVLECPTIEVKGGNIQVRPVLVKTNHKFGTYCAGEEKFRLYPASGDAYIMDSEFKMFSPPLCFYHSDNT